MARPGGGSDDAQKEIKNNENRVALTPAGAFELTKRNHTVYVQSTAGEGSGFADAEYVEAGAKILPTMVPIPLSSITCMVDDTAIIGFSNTFWTVIITLSEKDKGGVPESVTTTLVLMEVRLS